MAQTISYQHDYPYNRQRRTAPRHWTDRGTRVYSTVMRGGGWLAGFLATMYAALCIYAASDGHGGIELPPPFAGVLLGAAGTFACTSAGMWAIRDQARETRRHVDTRIEQQRDDVRADTEKLISNELTQLMPRLDANMLHTLQQTFRAEGERLARTTTDKGYRSGLVARATAAVPNQTGGRILPLRARED